jgi:hypothetical protein
MKRVNNLCLSRMSAPVVPVLLAFGRPRRPAFLLLPQLTFLG